MNASDCFDSPIAFHRVFVTLTGSICAAVMLSQAVYWSKRSPTKDGWFYKTQEEWEDETGLTRREQETAREKLRAAGFWMEERRGMPGKLWFKVDMAALVERVRSQPGGKRHSRMAESAIQERTDAPDKNGEMRQSNIGETTTEITTSPLPPGGGRDGEVVPGPELCQRLGAAFRLTTRELATLHNGGERMRLVVALDLDRQTLGFLERLWRIPNGEMRGGQKIYHTTSLSAFLDAPDKDISRARALFASIQRMPVPSPIHRDVPLPEPEPAPEVKRARMASLKAAVDPRHRLSTSPP